MGLKIKKLVKIGYKNRGNNKLTKRGFSLTGSIISLGLILLLSMLVLNILKPSKSAMSLRDTRRINDLAQLNNIMKIILLETKLRNLGLSPNTIYLSLPMQSATTNCKVDYPFLPDVDFNYYCAPASNYLNTNGTGWIPINFSDFKLINLKALPADPLNSEKFFYSLVIDEKGNFEFTALLEDQGNQLASLDKGDNDSLFEAGSLLTLTPIDFQDWRIYGSPVCYFKVWHTPEAESVRGIAVLSSGEYIIYGDYYLSFLPADIFLIKVNKLGEKIWSKKITGSGSKKIVFLKQFTENEILLVGNTNIRGNWDILVIKLNLNGDILFQKLFGGSNTDMAADAFVISENEIVIAGMTDSYGAGNKDGFIMTIDNNLNLIKFRTYGGSYNDEFKSLDFKFNNIVLTGYTENFGASWSDLIVSKLNRNLELIWLNRYFGLGWWEKGNSVKIDSSGNIIIGGDGGNLWNNWDWLIKLNPLGNIEWSYSILRNISSNNWINSVEILENTNEILIGGEYVGKGFGGKITSSGNVVFLKSFERPYNTAYIYKILQRDLGYLAIGSARCVRYDDIWLIKMDKNADIKIQEGSCANITSLSISPYSINTNFASSTSLVQVYDWENNVFSSTTNYTVQNFNVSELNLASSCK